MEKLNEIKKLYNQNKKETINYFDSRENVINLLNIINDCNFEENTKKIKIAKFKEINFDTIIEKISKINTENKDFGEYIFKKEDKIIILKDEKNIFVFDSKYNNKYNLEENKIYDFQKLLNYEILEEIHFDNSKMFKEESYKISNYDYKKIASISGEEFKELSNYVVNKKADRYYLKNICIKTQKNIICTSNGCRLFTIKNRVLKNDIKEDITFKINYHNIFKNDNIDIMYNEEKKYVLLNFNCFKIFQYMGDNYYPDIDRILREAEENKSIKINFSYVEKSDIKKYKNIVFDYINNKIYFNNEEKNIKKEIKNYTEEEKKLIFDNMLKSLGKETEEKKLTYGINLKFIENYIDCDFIISDNMIINERENYIYITLFLLEKIED